MSGDGDLDPGAVRVDLEAVRSEVLRQLSEPRMCPATNVAVPYARTRYGCTCDVCGKTGRDLYVCELRKAVMDHAHKHLRKRGLGPHSERGRPFMRAVLQSYGLREEHDASDT